MYCFFRLQLTNLQGSHGLRQFQVSNTILAGNCPRIPRCNSGAKYRTIDGTCNNLQNPLFGATNTPLQRILPPKYDDGNIIFLYRFFKWLNRFSTSKKRYLLIQIKDSFCNCTDINHFGSINETISQPAANQPFVGLFVFVILDIRHYGKNS